MALPDGLAEIVMSDSLGRTWNVPRKVIRALRDEIYQEAAKEAPGVG